MSQKRGRRAQESISSRGSKRSSTTEPGQTIASNARRGLLLALTVWLSGSSLAASRPRPIAPGEVDSWQVVPEACATFHWVPSSTSREVELVAYGVKTDDDPGVEDGLEPAARVSLPGGAAGWTLPLGECLARGQRYAWSIRERTDDGWTEWSDALFFEVSTTPSAREVREAALLLERAASLAAFASRESGEVAKPETTARSGTALASESDRSAVSAPGSAALDRPAPRRRSLRAAIGPAAIRGDQTDVSGETYGVHGISSSGAGGSAGLIGESVATSGPVVGVLGRVASPEGTAGLFENTGGGPILEMYGPNRSFAVSGIGDMWLAGSFTAATFAGDGSGLFGIDAELVDGQPASAYGGDIRSVTAGSGLTGGGTSGEVTVAVADGGVTSQHLAPSSVTASEIASNAVDGSKVKDSSLTSVDLATDTITALELQDGSIRSATVANASLTTSDFDTGSIQRRVTGECGSSRSIRSIDANGNVICEYDDFLEVGVSGQWEANAPNGNNDFVTIPAGNNFCYLVYVRLRDIEDSDETATCQVSYSPASNPPIWRLAATSNNDADAKCRMRCLTW